MLFFGDLVEVPTLTEYCNKYECRSFKKWVTNLKIKLVVTKIDGKRMIAFRLL